MGGIVGGGLWRASSRVDDSHGFISLTEECTVIEISSREVQVDRAGGVVVDVHVFQGAYASQKGLVSY